MATSYILLILWMLELEQPSGARNHQIEAGSLVCEQVAISIIICFNDSVPLWFDKAWENKLFHAGR